MDCSVKSTTCDSNDQIYDEQNRVLIIKDFKTEKLNNTKNQF